LDAPHRPTSARRPDAAARELVEPGCVGLATVEVSLRGGKPTRRRAVPVVRRVAMPESSSAVEVSGSNGRPADGVERERESCNWEFCLLLGLAASVEDLWRRRISNQTVLAGLAAGLALQIAARGWLRGPAAWMGGAAVGFAVFLIFFLLTAFVGALGACGYLFQKWVRRRWSGHTAPEKDARGNESIPYAPAILVGALLSFL
jgi:Flp pilus assembly protein protease CpaA